MSDYHHVASIVLLNEASDFILQRRDDKLEIRNPGMITAWGGAVEGNETPIEAAVREMSEETNLHSTASDLEYFGDYVRDYKIDGKQVVNHIFFIRDVDENTLEVHEGQGFTVISPSVEPKNPLFTNLTIEIITDFNLKGLKGNNGK